MSMLFSCLVDHLWCGGLVVVDGVALLDLPADPARSERFEQREDVHERDQHGRST
jgi:hypothetical protein